MIKSLNPVLRGWAEYFRISCHYRRAFIRIGYYVWWKVWKRAKSFHPIMRGGELKGRYVRSCEGRSWRFIGGNSNRTLLDMATVTTWVLRPIKQKINPYTHRAEHNSRAESGRGC